MAEEGTQPEVKAEEGPNAPINIKVRSVVAPSVAITDALLLSSPYLAYTSDSQNMECAVPCSPTPFPGFHASSLDSGVSGRILDGRGDLLQDQAEYEAQQTSGRICEQGRKGRSQHSVRICIVEPRRFCPASARLARNRAPFSVRVTSWQFINHDS